jgi:hypothetical protein
MTNLINRMLIGACLVLALIGAGSVELRAQTGSLDSACTCQVNKTYNVDLCIGGVTYNADVKFCETNYAAPFPTGTCETRFGQNRFSVLREICFTGVFPPGATHAQILGAVLLSISTTGCNIPSPYGFTVPNNGLYCWEIALPKCTDRVGNCIVPCEECKFCIRAYRWQRLNGVCTFSQTRVCDPGPCQGTTCDENSGCPDIVTCP